MSLASVSNWKGCEKSVICCEDLKAYGHNLVPQRIQFKIACVHLIASQNKSKTWLENGHSMDNDRMKLRATGVAQFYYINWKSWR